MNRRQDEKSPTGLLDGIEIMTAKEAARRLQEAGIVDAAGRRIRKDLPADMREGQDRDFGG